MTHFYKELMTTSPGVTDNYGEQSREQLAAHGAALSALRGE